MCLADTASDSSKSATVRATLTRQPFQALVEALFHFRQQPASLRRGSVFGKAQRAVQHHGRGLARRPDDCFHRVPTHLFQGGDPFKAIDDYVAAA